MSSYFYDVVCQHMLVEPRIEWYQQYNHQDPQWVMGHVVDDYNYANATQGLLATQVAGLANDPATAARYNTAVTAALQAVATSSLALMIATDYSLAHTNFSQVFDELRDRYFYTIITAIGNGQIPNAEHEVIADFEIHTAEDPLFVLAPRATSTSADSRAASIWLSTCVAALEPELTIYKATNHGIFISEGDLTVEGTNDPTSVVTPPGEGIYAELPLISPAVFGNGYVPPQVTGTIDSALTVLITSILSDDFTVPSITGVIEADFPIISPAIEATCTDPPTPIIATIDDAPLTLIGVSIDADWFSFIGGTLPSIAVEILAGVQVVSTAELSLPLITTEIAVAENKIGRFRASLTRISADLGGGEFAIRAGLPIIGSNLSTQASGPCVVKAALPRTSASITGNFNTASRLTRMRSNITARVGEKAQVVARLSSLGSTITGYSALTATLPRISSTIVAWTGELSNIKASLTVIGARLKPGNMVGGPLPTVGASLTVRPIRYAKITAKLSRATGTIDAISYSELPSITAQLPHLRANLSPNASGLATVTGTVDARIYIPNALLQEQSAVQGEVGTVSAKLTRITSNFTVRQGVRATCNAVMPGVIRAKITAKRGARGTISAKLNTPTSRIV